MAHLQIDGVLIGEFDGSGVLRVDQVVVFGYEAHEVGDLADDDAVGSSQAAGGRQVAAGVTGLQGSGGGCCARADGAAPSQV